MRGEAKSLGYRPTSFDEYVRERLWRSDPNLTGKGIGLLISERRGRWTVRRVLKKSPAERVGIEPGAVLHEINDYDMRKDVDVAELQMSVRFQAEECGVSLEARGSAVRMTIRPTWLRGIIGRDIGLDGGGYCNSCKKCYSTINGFVTCGEGGCPDRCAVV